MNLPSWFKTGSTKAKKTQPNKTKLYTLMAGLIALIKHMLFYILHLSGKSNAIHCNLF